MRISDWSSDVCSSDLAAPGARERTALGAIGRLADPVRASRAPVRLSSPVRLSRRCTATMKANSILETIGHTPHIRVSRLFPDAEVWIKSERSNPGGSIKDRIGLAMIEAAERDGLLKAGGTIVEPTSGNTGIGLAMAAAVKGYKLILVMPESMSVERRRLMLAYGATFALTPREKGVKGEIRSEEHKSELTEL